MAVTPALLDLNLLTALLWPAHEQHPDHVFWSADLDAGTLTAMAPSLCGVARRARSTYTRAATAMSRPGRAREPTRSSTPSTWCFA